MSQTGLGRRDYKEAAIEQWTADPCGASWTPGQPGSREYLARIIEDRQRYARWMDSILDYEAWAGMTVLDVGCGQGIDLARYALAGADATGLDLTPRHLELTRALLEFKNLRAETVLGDAEALPFESASFDRVSSNGVLHHTPDMPAALREIHRVLKPGGEILVIVYNRNSLHYWLHQFALHGIVLGKLFRERSMEGVMSRTVEGTTSGGARPLVRVYTRRRLRRMLEAAGFRGVETWVRHFRADDTVPTRLASRFLPQLREPVLLDRIGHAVGWYVVGRAVAA